MLVGLPLNFANIIALPLLLGVGVAFKIYYIMAWREGQTNLLQTSLTRAVIYSALTTATAFGSLIFSSYPGTSSMGELLALSLVCTLAAAVLFRPILMGKPRTGHRRAEVFLIAQQENPTMLSKVLLSALLLAVSSAAFAQSGTPEEQRSDFRKALSSQPSAISFILFMPIARSPERPESCRLGAEAALFGSRLASLLLQPLVRVAHALVLVRIGFAQRPHVGGYLAHLLPVHAATVRCVCLGSTATSMPVGSGTSIGCE